MLHELDVPPISFTQVMETKQDAHDRQLSKIDEAHSPTVIKAVEMASWQSYKFHMSFDSMAILTIFKTYEL